MYMCAHPYACVSIHMYVCLCVCMHVYMCEVCVCGVGVGGEDVRVGRSLLGCP